MFCVGHLGGGDGTTGAQNPTPLLSSCRYEDEINKRTAAENEFVVLKKVSDTRDRASETNWERQVFGQHQGMGPGGEMGSPGTMTEPPLGSPKPEATRRIWITSIRL